MFQSGKNAKDRLIDATIEVIHATGDPKKVTIREIARVAGTSISALYRSYASLDDLIVAAAKLLYAQVNHERMSALQQAVDSAKPDPAPLRDLLAALIGPSVRWSLDTARPYAVFQRVNNLPAIGGVTSATQPLIDQIAQHQAFITYLQRSAPWFNDVEIGWRVNAALGVRSQVLRETRRTMLLTQNRLDLTDPEVIIDLMLDVIEPMFHPRGRFSNTQKDKRPSETERQDRPADFHIDAPKNLSGPRYERSKARIAKRF